MYRLIQLLGLGDREERKDGVNSILILVLFNSDDEYCVISCLISVCSVALFGADKGEKPSTADQLRSTMHEHLHCRISRKNETTLKTRSILYRLLLSYN